MTYFSFTLTASLTLLAGSSPHAGRALPTLSGGKTRILERRGGGLRVGPDSWCYSSMDDIPQPTLRKLGVAAFVSLSQIVTGAHSFSFVEELMS